jgi:type II secretory pathway component PulF
MLAAGIIYAILTNQIVLGLAMIATASTAYSRHINAGSRSIDRVFLILGRLSMVVGAFSFLASTGLIVSNNNWSNFWESVGIVLTLFYALLIFFGGRLQSRVAASLLQPLPIAEQRLLEWRIAALRAVGWTLALMPIGPVAGIYFLVAALFGRTVRIQQESLLLIVAIAMRTHAPLAEEVEALADSSRGRFRNRLRMLANRLRSGENLSVALDALPGLAPPETVTAIRLGEEMGNVVPVIQDEAIRLRRREENRLQGRFSAAGMAFYVCTFLIIANGIVGFLVYWIVPKFKKIFQDFGVQLPTPTERLIEAIDWSSEYWPFIVLASGAVLLWLVFSLVRRGGWSGFDSSFASAVYPRLQTPAVLRNLSHAVAARRSLAEALTAMELHHPRRSIRRRLRRIRDEAVQGRDVFEPLRGCGLVSAPEAAALASAERAGNLAWALETIADNIERRQRALAQTIAETVQPAIVVALGFMVLMICIGFFYPIIRLIQVTL